MGMFDKDKTKYKEFKYEEQRDPRLARPIYELRQGGYDERSPEQRRRDQLADQKELERLEYKERLYDAFRPADEFIGNIMTVTDPEAMAEELFPSSELASSVGFAAGMLGPGKFRDMLEKGSEYLLKKGLAKNKREALEMTRDDIIRRRAKVEQNKLDNLKPYEPKQKVVKEEYVADPMDLEEDIELTPYIKPDTREFKERMQVLQKYLDEKYDPDLDIELKPYVPKKK